MSMGIYFRRASPAQIERLRTIPADWPEFALEEEGDRAGWDFEWHALNFLLTGSKEGGDHPLGIIMADGEAVGADEFGNGLFDIISPERVKAFHEAVSVIDDDLIMSRYDPAKFINLDLYKARLFADDVALGREDLREALRQLREFASICAEAGDGAIRMMG
jgi:hypothetical protein